MNQRKKMELERLFAALETYMRYTQCVYQPQVHSVSPLSFLLGIMYVFFSKRSTAYLPAVQVWTTDQPHPQKDVSPYHQYALIGRVAYNFYKCVLSINISSL